MRRETAIQQNDGVDMLPLELGLLRASTLCLSGARSSANMPGNAALYDAASLTYLPRSRLDLPRSRLGLPCLRLSQNSGPATEGFSNRGINFKDAYRSK